MAEPLIISTWSFGLRGHAAAWPGLLRGDSSLDAVEAACVAVEEDPEVDSVGYGGLPDCEGNVSLDAAIMRSPEDCGSVVAVKHHLHVTSIARRVMERTPHMMLAGADADAFADAQGLPRAELLSPEARAKWEAWRAKPQAAPDAEDQSRDRGYAPPRPIDLGGAHGGRLFHCSTHHPPLTPHRSEERWRHQHDTIGVLALNARGELAGACSTSGTPWKLSGRVGDSAIIGHGLYVHPQWGAATATGTGELIMGVCGSFLTVECMRRGATALEALKHVLQLIADNYDFTKRGTHDQVALLSLRPTGEWAAAALRSGFRVSITTASRNEAIEPQFVLWAE